MHGLLREDKPLEGLPGDGNSKTDRTLGISSVPDRPGVRPAPHRENVGMGPFTGAMYEKLTDFRS